MREIKTPREFFCCRAMLFRCAAQRFWGIACLGAAAVSLALNTAALKRGYFAFAQYAALGRGYFAFAQYAALGRGCFAFAQYAALGRGYFAFAQYAALGRGCFAFAQYAALGRGYFACAQYAARGRGYFACAQYAAWGVLLPVGQYGRPGAKSAVAGNYLLKRLPRRRRFDADFAFEFA